MRHRPALRKPGSRSRPRVRFGGERTPSGFRFELNAGHLCLDLANTVDERRTATPRELLPGYADLLSWGRQAGAIGGGEARLLAAQAQAKPAAAAQSLSRAHAIRETIFLIFAAIARQARPPQSSLADLNRAVAAALPARELFQKGRAWRWRFRIGDPPQLDRVLWPALVSAADLLTSGDLHRVRECAGKGCAWLFLDHSRNRTRRWCDMTVCGNRAKVRRYRALHDE